MDFYRYPPFLYSFSHFDRLPIREKEKFAKILKGKGDLVEILAYCLMPTHFHLLLRQLKPRGIPIMLANIQNGYARFFNLRNRRAGPLFRSIFKAIRIENDEQILHVSRYIHLNPSSSYLTKIKDLPSYTWSSLPEYLEQRVPSFISTEFLLKMIGGKKRYQEFVFDQAEYQRKLQEIKHLSLENP